MVYIGRSRDIITRVGNHLARVVFAERPDEITGTLVYNLAKGREVLFFHILDSEDETAVAFAEAAWSAALGSYCVKKDFLELRLEHHLPNIGDGVAGANATMCLESPTPEPPGAPRVMDAVVKARLLRAKRLIASLLREHLSLRLSPAIARIEGELDVIWQLVQQRTAQLSMAGEYTMTLPTPQFVVFLAGVNLPGSFVSAAVKGRTGHLIFHLEESALDGTSDLAIGSSLA